jgi:uncharacterized protein YbjT (DUF2867 family)
MDDRPVLIVGATGYVGGRLARKLMENRCNFRALGRSLEKLSSRPWAASPGVSLVKGDVGDYPSLIQAMTGCRAAYYLVHSMGPGQKNYAEIDRNAAANMARAAAECGLERIIYLGGLGDARDESLSEHLRSRLEVATVLREGPVPVTFFRAAVILGSGSASFEIIRSLTERLPVMITPRWVRTECQPIAISNVVEYLAACLGKPETTGQTYEIGGPDILTYGELFQTYAREAGLKPRVIIPVPVLSPGLSSLWVGMISPVPSGLARPLINGLRNRVVCSESRIRGIIPQRLLSCREAIALALDKIRQLDVETCWSDAGHPVPPEWLDCGDPAYAGATIRECACEIRVRSKPMDLWEIVARLGGVDGWHYADILWRIRGGIDRLTGGAGLGRGRRRPRDIRPGDAPDYWRVLKAVPGERLILQAEMKVPGEALLDVRVFPVDGDRSDLVLFFRFLPRGLWGLMYGYAAYPLHVQVFKGMLMNMIRTSGIEVVSGPGPVTSTRAAAPR